MKKMIISVLLLTVFGCFGTDQGESTTYVYSVINESGKLIRIETYISRLPNVDPIITNLSEGEIITKTYHAGPLDGLYSFAQFFGDRDSIVIIYNNSKIQLFEIADSSVRNPLNRSIYGDTEETFIFTEEDYENAEDCDGDCN